jgi:hypothetical protein
MRLRETKEFIEACDIGWGFETELLMNPAPFPSNDTSQIEDDVLGSCEWRKIRKVALQCLETLTWNKIARLVEVLIRTHFYYIVEWKILDQNLLIKFFQNLIAKKNWFTYI